MQRDIFAAGTVPGSPATENEIKILICYLLGASNEPLTFEQLHAALREHELVNYFELIAALDALVESEHVLKTGEPTAYQIADLGRATAQTLDSVLPLTVREKALAATTKIVERQKRLQEVHAEIQQMESGGFQLELSIPESDTDLVFFRLYAPTLPEAEKLRNGFLNDPIFLYQAVMALLNGDLSVLGDLRPANQKLFE